MKKYIIPIQIPYSKEEKEKNKEDVKKIIEESLKEAKDIENSELKIITSPKYITKEFLKLYKTYNIKNIELEVYSTNKYILERAGIEHTLDDIKKAAKMIRFNRFKLGLKMVIGLPESTKIDDVNTAKTLVKLKPKSISIDAILVMKGTKLEKEIQEKKYKPLTLVQAVETSKEIVKIFNSKNIEIESIDFRPKVNEQEQGTFMEQFVDGPFHPEFRQLVESGLWYDAIVAKIKKLNTKVMEVEVTVNSIDTNNVIGYKQENISKLKEIYDVDLIVTPDENIKQGRSKIEITKLYKDFVE